VIRVYILGEGQTEEAVIKDVLAPHFAPTSVYLYPIIVKTSPGHKGGGHWRHWKKDIHRVLEQQQGSEVRVSTLFDLFRLPKDFPGLLEHGEDTDTNRRCDELQKKMAQVFNDPRFIPYLQRHELEALVLACTESLRDLFDAQDDLKGLEHLEQEIAETAPEDIDDGPETAPSKRLLRHIPGYSKTLHGSMAIEDTGLGVVRERCPRFDKWVATLEALAEQRER